MMSSVDTPAISNHFIVIAKKNIVMTKDDLSTEQSSPFELAQIKLTSSSPWHKEFYDKLLLKE